MADKYTWVPFYTELAGKILEYKDDRPALISKVRESHTLSNKELPKVESDNDNITDIDPFTVFALFNRGKQSDDARSALCGGFKDAFSVDADAPSDFEGIPTHSFNNYCFYAYVGDPRRNPDCFDILWNLFSEAIGFANGDNNGLEFKECFDKALKLPLVGLSKLTIGLFQVRPNTFVSLDGNNQTLIENKLNKKLNIQNGSDYLTLCAEVKVFIESSPECSTLSEFSSLAYGKKTPETSDLSNNDSYTSISVEEENEKYSKEAFLDEVYMTEDQYDSLVSLLKNKMNLILQGAPGVGKTFAAKRLAYSIMGEKDESRIEFVQFHQNYSYEDFMMGYKPTDTGFELKSGIFYRFCTLAANHPDKDYFFIIDEINRGNMSKIFGELLMLIEKDYRGTKATLAYNGMSFSVSENLYIIGLMNTADRSLAMIDYALRRRFSFFNMVPGFDSDGFKTYQGTIAKDKFDKLVDEVKNLNKAIAEDKSLGNGFCIGHSYFCGHTADEDDTWIKEIVDYDIIPMLNEYWFDDSDRVEEWSNKLSGAVNG